MFKHNIKSILPLSIALLAWGCEEVIELDVDQTPPQYVIEGLITDELTDHYVKISTSTDFYDPAATPGVSEASVSVSDDRGQPYVLEESETEPGRYTARFRGEVGRTYTMQATLPDGEVFTATDQMRPVISIDSLTWEVDEAAQEDPEEPGLFYDVRIFAAEPQATVDYYLFKFYRNDSLQNFDSETGLFYSDDELLGEYIYGLEAPVYFRAGDVGAITTYSISRPAFLFYGDLDNTLNGDGGMLSPSPANPRTNIVHDRSPGLGFFQVSAVTRATLVVGE